MLDPTCRDAAASPPLWSRLRRLVRLDGTKCLQPTRVIEGIPMMQEAASPYQTAESRRPPAPFPLRHKLGPIALYRAARENSIAIWHEDAYADDIIVDRGPLG